MTVILFRGLGGQALSSCSPSAALQRAGVSWKEALHLATALVFVSGAPVFAVAAQGMPLDCLALVDRGTCICGSYGIVANQRDGSWQAASPGTEPAAD